MHDDNIMEVQTVLIGDVIDEQRSIDWLMDNTQWSYQIQ